jgi:hypothetical protein
MEGRRLDSGVYLYGCVCFVSPLHGKEGIGRVDGRAMVRGFGGWEVWMLPVMYTVFRDLRFLAIQV